MKTNLLILISILVLLLIAKTIFFNFEPFKVLKTYNNSINGFKMLKLDNKEKLRQVFEASKENNIPYWYGIKYYPYPIYKVKWSDKTELPVKDWKILYDLTKGYEVINEKKIFDETNSSHNLYTDKELKDGGRCIKIFDNKIYITSCLDKAYYMIDDEDTLYKSVFQQIKKK